MVRSAQSQPVGTSWDWAEAQVWFSRSSHQHESTHVYVILYQ